MRIAELAATAGVPTSSVRYYERIGLLPAPERTAAGYRDYDDVAGVRLLFIHRARDLGLTCEEVRELLTVWDGNDCQRAQRRVTALIDRKQAEISERIAELEVFSAQLDAARTDLLSSAPPETCRVDLSCCLPDGPTAEKIPVPLRQRRATDHRRHGERG